MIHGLNRQQFFAWVEQQPDGKRYELDHGEPIAMAPERARHNVMKALIWQAFDRELRRRGAKGCQAFTDGMTVYVDDDNVFEPDALINCGPPVDPLAIVAPSPVVIVEVTSDSSRGVDTGRKMAAYFRLPSVMHYLIVFYDKRTIIHHALQDGDTILSRILSGGTIPLDPPGIDLDMDEVYRLADGG
ncbi:MAG: hypothetical protein RLY86_265 [Pseudomonadota bacterium]|jgi:Uma2 family endonuclease